jgi:TonB family protein
MRYNDDSCQLLAGFGAGDDHVIMSLVREQPGDPFTMELYGKPLRYEGINMPMELTLGEGASTTKLDGVALKTSGKASLPVVRLGLRIDGWSDFKHPESAPVITPEREATVTQIGFHKPAGKRYVLQTGGMGAVFAAMRNCTTDLVKSWGYDPVVQATLSKSAIPVDSPANWLHDSDYPNMAWINGHNGLVRFRLDVGPDGKPTGCRVLYRTNPDEFADLTCSLIIKRARFSPALDAKGTPVKTFYINNARWVMADW